MHPRLQTSKKYTSLPADFITQVSEVFNEGFGAHLKNAKLIIEGRIYAEEILLRVGVLEKGRLAQANFEVSIDNKSGAKDTLDKLHSCIDAVASMMVEYFENDGEVEFPRTWQEYTFEEQKLFLQFSAENTELEKQADAILGVDNSNLVIGEDDEEETESEEETDTTQPTLFSGKGKKKKSDLHQECRVEKAITDEEEFSQKTTDRDFLIYLLKLTSDLGSPKGRARKASQISEGKEPGVNFSKQIRKTRQTKIRILLRQR